MIIYNIICLLISGYTKHALLVLSCVSFYLCFSFWHEKGSHWLFFSISSSERVTVNTLLFKKLKPPFVAPCFTTLDRCHDDDWVIGRSLFGSCQTPQWISQLCHIGDLNLDKKHVLESDCVLLMAHVWILFDLQNFEALVLKTPSHHIQKSHISASGESRSTWKKWHQNP